MIFTVGVEYSWVGCRIFLGWVFSFFELGVCLRLFLGTKAWTWSRALGADRQKLVTGGNYPKAKHVHLHGNVRFYWKHWWSSFDYCVGTVSEVLHCCCVQYMYCWCKFAVLPPSEANRHTHCKTERQLNKSSTASAKHQQFKTARFKNFYVFFLN